MKRGLLTVLATIVLLWAGIVQAQEQTDAPIDYNAWEQLADLTETAIDKDTGTIDELEVLRGGVIRFRARFETARAANGGRIGALKAQIEALGPKPETGTEAPEVATRRAELEQQLQELQAPAVVADEAFRRADAIIAEIDKSIRDGEFQKNAALLSAIAHAKKGNGLMAKKEYALALESYDEAARELPQSRGVQLNRGLALLAEDLGEQAKEAFMAAADPAAAPDIRADAYYNLGIAYAREGQLDHARALFEQAARSEDRVRLETATGEWVDSRWLAIRAIALLDAGEFGGSERLAAR